jgi:hypothetical protein
LNKIKHFLILCILFIIVPVPILSQNINRSVDLFSPVNRRAFGDYLFCEKDYLRAIPEFREYLGFENNDTTRFKLAASFFELGRYTEAIDNYKALFFSSPLSEEARLEYHKCNFFRNNFDLFRLQAESEVYATEKYGDIIKKLYVSSYFLEGNILPDSLRLLEAFQDGERSKMLDYYHRKKYPEYKNETLGGVLSAAVPGLGKVYADEIGDGVLAFLYSAVFGYLTYSSFENDHTARGWIFAGLTAYFYASNIYGSIAAVQNYNAGVRFSLDSDFKLYLQNKNYYLPKYDFICE